jgi:hypothetical protein
MQPPDQLSPAAPGSIGMSPASVIRALDQMLRQRGMTRVYSATCAVFGVISVTSDLTVWTNGRVLLWRFNGMPDAYPAADLEAAAERLATLATSAADPRTFRDGER